jgi:hypothetical protein
MKSLIVVRKINSIKFSWVSTNTSALYLLVCSLPSLSNNHSVIRIILIAPTPRLTTIQQFKIQNECSKNPLHSQIRPRHPHNPPTSMAGSASPYQESSSRHRSRRSPGGRWLCQKLLQQYLRCLNHILELSHVPGGR